jgi:hypothetical protein
MPTLAELDEQISQLEGQLTQAQQGGEAPDYSAFFKSPGYEFRFEEGLRASDRSAAARGMLMSGGHMRELQRYGQGLASSEFGNYANRLSSLAGIGQSAAFNSGQLGVQAAGQVGAGSGALAGTILAGGQAQAEGIVGGSNAMLGGIGGAIGQINWPSAQTPPYNPGAGGIWETGAMNPRGTPNPYLGAQTFGGFGYY